ncbi:MAG TPA: hypothetical protein VGM89_16635, partial [Puia sp.]
FHGLFYPLQGGIKRYAGSSFPRFRKEALDYFRVPSGGAGVEVGALSVQAAADSFARAHRHFVAHEEFPQFLGRTPGYPGSFLYMRSSYKRIPAFYIRNPDSGLDRKLLTRAVSLDNYFSYRNGRAVYSAYETDARWGWRDYGVIRVVEVGNRRDLRITRRSRYFAPDISEDGATVVAVQEAADGSCELQLLDASTGKILRRLPNPDRLFYTYPKFYPAGDGIVTAVRNRHGEMSLALVHLHDSATQYLLPFSYQAIAFPSVSGDTIWFSASREGRNRIYGLAGGNLFEVGLPHGEPGAGQYQFQSGPAGRSVWNSFTAVGFHADTATRQGLRLEPVAISDWVKALSLQRIDSLEKGPSHLLDQITPGNYPATKYPLASHLFNFHSWRPYINDPDYQLSLVSDNILNTFETQIYGDYNRNEQYKQVGVTATYGGLYPTIDAGWNYTFDRNALYGGRKVYWNESETHAGLSIPLNWTRGTGYTSLQFGSDIVYNQRTFTGLYKDSFNSRGFAYINPYISFVHQSQQAQMQIAPRFAQVLNLSYSSAVTPFSAHQFLASGFLYLPGVAFTHSLMLAAAFQQRDTLGNARFSNGFPFSRGYSAENFYRLWRVSGNYQLPLFYPDWGFGDIVYFLRVRANLYYDYTHAMDYYTNGRVYNADFRSFGSEVYFDTKWWNQLSVSFGIRYSRLLDPDFEGRGPNQWELILPLNLLSQGYSGKAVKNFD